MQKQLQNSLIECGYEDTHDQLSASMIMEMNSLDKRFKKDSGFNLKGIAMTVKNPQAKFVEWIHQMLGNMLKCMTLVV